MEIKRLPEDFLVEELTDVRPAHGDFALYRLTKRWIGTPEAIDAVLRTWNVARRRVAYGGMKDFHAVTQQYVTIHRGPQRDLPATRFRLEYLGQTPRAFASTDIRANRFRIVVRDLREADLAPLGNAVARAQQEGVPNYFDDQRFGSVGAAGEFIARPWVLGDYERALWLALADPNEHDTAAEARQKQLLQTLWGRWPECKAALARSHRRSVVTYLADHPDDYRGAFACLRVDLRRLYLSAFQSHLWNALLAAYLCQTCRAEQLGFLRGRFGPLPFPESLGDDQIAALHAAALPLPSSRAQCPDAAQRQLAESVLGQFGLSLAQLRVKYPRDCFFSRGMRKAMTAVAFDCEPDQPDEVYPGRRKLTLAFELPRGSYATVAIKRLTASLE